MSQNNSAQQHVEDVYGSMDLKIIKTFDGGYNRVGVITVKHMQCDVCGNDKKCIYVDRSECEYAGGAICLACATKILTEEE